MSASAGRSAVYGEHNLYDLGQVPMDDLRASGFTTVILWKLNIDKQGDLYYCKGRYGKDRKLVSDGAYVGDPEWPSHLATLKKQQPTSVTRLELSIGEAGGDDWSIIKDSIGRHGTGPSSVLYRNFQALRKATGADAINNDDEECYDADSTVTFAKMTQVIGYTGFTLAPYTNVAHWRGVKDGLGAFVDRVYLQAYSGGASNDPQQWTRDLGMPVDPGLWSVHDENGGNCNRGDDPTAVKDKMSAWNTPRGSVPGGFMFLYEDMMECSKAGKLSDYARVINEATGGAVAP
ncbi:hypothetical protein [Kitasatospora sp. NPDC056731]|uniref:hypothetical protein n=1 Tax=Kitasatospora sp. NPDC056731 TaxID=3155422 RepID=UPI00341CF500